MRHHLATEQQQQYILAITDNVALSMRLQIFLQHSVCISFEYISQNKIAESYFQFFMLFYAFSPSNSTYLQPHQQVTRVIFSLHL